MGIEVLSVFSGIGGIDYGLEAAGFQNRICIDRDKDCELSIEANTKWNFIREDIEYLAGKEVLRAAGIRKRSNFTLVGGPPCQPFSKAGYWTSGTLGGLRDPRAAALEGYFSLLEQTLPKVFLFENVPGFLSVIESGGLEYFQKKIAKINQRQRTNYKISWNVLDSADFGVPQHRRRLFIIGSRDGKLFKFPECTHLKDKNQYITAWDAIYDLENKVPREEYKLSGKWAGLLPSIPEGNNYLWHTERGGGQELFQWRGHYWNFLLKLAKDKPSWTISAQPGSATGPFHWKSRKLSEKELLRLQSLPDTIQFNCSWKTAIRLIGNSVPSSLVEVLGIEIRKQFYGDSFYRKRRLIYQKQEFVPRKERTRVIPRRYIENGL